MIVSNWVLLIEDNGYAKCWMGGSADQLLEVWINYPSLTTKYHIKP